LIKPKSNDPTEAGPLLGTGRRDMCVFLSV
jgi:hypothetical protein